MAAWRPAVAAVTLAAPVAANRAVPARDAADRRAIDQAGAVGGAADRTAARFPGARNAARG